MNHNETNKIIAFIIMFQLNDMQTMNIIRPLNKIKTQLDGESWRVRGSLRGVLWLVLLAGMLVQGEAQDMTIGITSYSSSVINRVADYQIYTDLTSGFSGYDIEFGSSLLIVFPPQYNTTVMRSKVYTGYNPSESDLCPFDPACSGVTVTYVGGNHLRINGLFTSNVSSATSIIFQYTIYGITNPSTITLDPFRIIIYKGSVVYYPLGGAFSFVSSPTIAAASVNVTTQISFPLIWATTPLRFDITPTTVIDTIRLNFGSTLRWSSEPNGPLMYSSVICASVSNPTIRCSQFSGTIIITNLFYFTANVLIDITIYSITNPSALINAGFIAISLQANSVTNQVTNFYSIPLGTFSSGFLRAFTTTLTYQTSDMISIVIVFNLAYTNLATDKISIRFPSQLTMPITSSSYTIRLANNAIPLASSLIVFTSSTNTLTFPISNIPKQTVSFTVTGVSRPRESKILSSFFIQSWRYNNFLMQSNLCCTLKLQNRKTLTINSIVTSNSTISIVTTYVFNISTSVVALTTTDAIIINFPSEYAGIITNAQSGTLCSSLTIATISQPTNVNSVFTCSVQLNVMTLSSFLRANSNITSQTLIITVGNLRNPAVTSLSSGFNIATVSSASFVLEEIDNFFITFQPITFYLTVASTSLVTNAENVIYTFTFANKSPLLNGYVIQVIFPSDYTYINYNTMTCTINAATIPCARVNSTYSTSINKAQLLIQQSIANISSVTVSGVTNPISRKPTATFQVNIKNINSIVIQSNFNSAIIVMTSSSTFTTLIVSAANQSLNTPRLESSIQTLNKATNSLWFTFVAPFNLVNPSSLQIIISNSAFLSYNSPLCISSQLSASCIVTTNSITNNVEIAYSSLGFISTNSKYFAIQVTNLTINNYKLIQINAILDVGGFSSLISASTTIPNMYSEMVSTYAITQTSYILNDATSVSLSLNLSSTILFSMANIRVFIPYEYGASSYAVTLPSSGFINSSFTINSLTNPQTITYTPFLFLIYDSTNNLIAFSVPNLTSSNVYSFELKCNLPCRTCSSVSICLDCYTTISWIQHIYFRFSNNTCTAACLQGQYLSNGVCRSCDLNCRTCSMYGSNFTNGSPTLCLTCNSFFYLSNGTCTSVCPVGTYISVHQCVACMSNCQTCSNYSNCISCQVPYILYLSQCMIACPPKTVLFVNTLSVSVCLDCPLNCVVCNSQQVPICLTCFSSYYLHLGSCYSDCSLVSSTLFSNYNGLCVVCECNSCSGYSFNCTSCASPLNLYLSQCLNVCPDGTYSSNGTCQPCFANCLICNSSTFCNLCQIPQVLYVSNTSSGCLLNCPNDTIKTINKVTFKFECLNCTSNCAQCSISPSFCLSCLTGFNLENNACVNSCSAGKHVINGSCLICAFECRVCQTVNPYNCSVCSANYFYYNESCSLSCPNGTYANISSLKCVACAPVCLTCVNSTNCTACQPIYFFYNSFCYSNCSSISLLFYSYNGSCMTCQRQCWLCLSNPYNCTNCSDSQYYFNPTDNSCKTKCSLPYYSNSSSCILCQLPCLTCDVTAFSCLSCSGTLTALNGICVSNCPDGYYRLNSSCFRCSSYCLECNALTCLSCQIYAFKYNERCVLDCSVTDLSLTIDNYCTTCANVPYCQNCQATTNKNFLCFLCVSPYVLFQGYCLNECPSNYMVEGTSNKCVKSTSYISYLKRLAQENHPLLPPFTFFATFIVIGLLLFLITKRAYIYTYHAGYLIALSSILQLAFLFYGVRNIVSLYNGDYQNNNKYIPLYVLLGSFGIKLVLNVCYVIMICTYYFNDIRFKEWKEAYPLNFRLSLVLVLIFGVRFYKLYYSKLLGKECFSYRIVSVQKFYNEDLLNWAWLLCDLGDIAAFVLISYNIFIEYSILYLYPFELILFKVAEWVMIAYDYKKPDRGFFIGDEEEAEKMILKEQQERERERRRMQIQSLVKLIRTKSAGQLIQDKLFQDLFVQDFRSVFDPNDYEDLPKVPNKKIEKNIMRGKFRKGKKISIEEKLKRFAESIKPKPKVYKDDSLLWKDIYWKPPKNLRQQKKPKQPMNQESMMKLLEDKQLFYGEQLNNIEIEDLDKEDGVYRDPRYKRQKKLSFFVDGDETMYNQFQDPSSLQFLQPEQESKDLNTLMNTNYARKRHLPKKQAQNRYDEQELRVLYHQPLKKRKSKANIDYTISYY